MAGSNKRSWFYAGWALFAFWGWALHVATGFLSANGSFGGGKHRGVIGTLDRLTRELLVDTLGRPATVALLLLSGLALAARFAGLPTKHKIE